MIAYGKCPLCGKFNSHEYENFGDVWYFALMVCEECGATWVYNYRLESLDMVYDKDNQFINLEVKNV